MAFGSSTVQPLEPQVQLFLASHIAETTKTLTRERAAKALHAVMLAPTRVDYVHRLYGGFEPSHRFAMNGVSVCSTLQLWF